MTLRHRALGAAVLAFLSLLGRAPAEAEEHRPPPEEQARRILASTRVRGGLIVHVGCGDGELTAALRANESYIVHGLDADAANIRRARAHIRGLGLSGKVSCERWRGGRLPYADNLANLLVSDDPDRVPMPEVMRVLVPGGAACLKKGGEWTAVVKPRSRDIDEWTHWLRGPDNNPVARDSVVGPPGRLQWVAGPPLSKHHEIFPPTIGLVVSAAGRVFYVEDTTPPGFYGVRSSWHLVARDAFNGVLLWKRSMPEWFGRTWPGGLGGWSGGPADYRRRLVAAGGRLYVTLGRRAPVSALDAATGETVRTYGEAADHCEILHENGLLVLSTRKDRRSDYRITAFEAGTGNTLWQGPGGWGIAIKEGKVFYATKSHVGALDLETGRKLWETAPPGEIARAHGWKPRRKPVERTLRLSGELRVAGKRNGNVVLLCPGNRGSVVALDAGSGEYLWVRRNDARGSWSRPVEARIARGLVWITGRRKDEKTGVSETYALGLDPRSGEVRKAVSAAQAWNAGHHQRCYPSKATERYVIYSRRAAEFLDLDTGEVTLHNWVRGACTYGVMPANGLLYAPPHSCRCYSDVVLRGMYALAPRPAEPQAHTPAALRRAQDGGTELAEGAAGLRRAQSSRRADSIERGPAFGLRRAQLSREPGRAAKGPMNAPEDWPTYRHDAMRSGSTLDLTGGPAGTRVSANLSPSWQVDFEGRPTSPVVAGGRLFITSPETHAVCALDARTGETLWTHTAGGRVDSPPTLTGGLALFGCADGWVYCLRAEGGELVWRFKGGALEGAGGRLVGAHGGVESAWPVHGSVLVLPGPAGPDEAGRQVAYFVAGRSSFLDGGMCVYGLDPTTGEKLYEHRLEGPFAEVGKTRDTANPGYVMPGALPDILVSDVELGGERIYLRQLVFDTRLETCTDALVNFYKSPRRTGENWGGDHKYWDNLLEVPRHALWHDPKWFFRSYFERFGGRRLYTTNGLLGGSWHNRSYWAYGQVVGQYLVFDGNRGFAVQAYESAARWSSYKAGRGYVLYAGRTAVPKEGEKLYALRPEDRDWTTRLPFRPRAMVLAGETLFVAGPPDPADPEEALAALEGKKGGRLLAVSAADGRKLAEYELDSPPVFEGMCAARGRLYVSTFVADGNTGRVVCMGAD